LQRPAFGAPSGTAAIENADLRRAHGEELPPDAGRGKQARLIVDHDRHAVADAEGSDLAAEFFRRQQHVRQAARFVGDAVDVEEYRAGNVSGEIFRAWIALSGGEVPTGVDRDDVRVVEAGR